MRHARGIRTGATAAGGAALLAAAGLLITALPAQAAAPTAQHTTADRSNTAHQEAGRPPTADVVPLPETDTPALVDDIHDPVDATAAPADAARGHLADKESRYKITEPRRDLVPVQTLKRGAEETVRLQQKHRGVPVLGGQYVVRMENKGGERAVTGTSGKYFTGLTAGTTPSVTEDTAVRRAVTATLTRFGGERLTRAAAAAPGARGGTDASRSLRGSSHGLVVIPRGEGVLAYHVTVRGTHPATGAPVFQHVYVDARAGYPVLQYTGIKTIAPEKAKSPESPEKAPAKTGPAAKPAAPGATPGTTGTGVRLDGTTVDLNIHRPAADGPYALADHARMADGSKNALTTWDARGKDVFDVAGTWPGDLKPFASPTPAFGKDATDSGAVDAHWAAGVVYDYYKKRHGRDGLDGRGSAINSLVGVTDFGEPYVNAFWDGTKMVYGSGDDTYRPLSADLDVVGHEMTHGVVEKTADLVYAGQSGALNEAFADYFGNAIDVDTSGVAMDDPDAGLIGEDLCRDAAKPRDCAFRDLDDGATTTKNFLGVTFGTDNGGVHLNSTIFSGALWDLRQDLGAERADRIVYKALTEYLTPLDGFTEARAAVLAAAKDLGADAGQLRAAKRSFNAHGIVPGWESALGVDSDTLLRKVNTDGVAVQAGGGWWTTSLSNDDGSEPYSVYAGRADGKGAPKLISPNDGRYHVLPATDGRTVVWAAYGPGGIDVLSRPLAGGPIKKLMSTQSDIMGLRVDAGVTVFDALDFFGGTRRVGFFRPGDPTPTYVDAGRAEVMTGLPSIAHGRIAYGKVYPDADTEDGYALGVELLDLRSGRTTLTGQLGEPLALGGTGLNSRHVFWLADENLGDDGQVGIHRARTDGTEVYAISSEYKPGALVATDLTVSETAVTVGAVPVSDSRVLSNDVLSKIWQLSTDGARKQRLSCNRGEQFSPAAVSGDQVVWLDGTTGWTNLVTRGRPAGNCG